VAKGKHTRSEKKKAQVRASVRLNKIARIEKELIRNPNNMVAKQTLTKLKGEAK